MSTKNDTENQQTKKDNKSLREQAINQEETQGKEINHQVEQRKEQHQPRDNA